MAIFTGTPGADNFVGGIENDVITGAEGDDRLSGGGGSDNISGDAGRDILEGGEGNDVLFSHGRTTDDIDPYYPNLSGAVSNDIYADVDILRGGAGDDYLFAGYGDYVDGGGEGSFGNRLYINFSGASSGVTADFRLLETQGSITIGGGIITNIQSIGYLHGSAYDDYLVSIDTYYPSGDAIFGGDGNDTIIGSYYSGWGNGMLSGGNGDDVIDATASFYGALVYGDDGNDIIRLNSMVDDVGYGGAGDDRIYGGSAVHGGDGNDLIVLNYSYYGGIAYGDAGNDEMRAADSGHTLVGGSGADRLIGGSGRDLLYAGDLDAEGMPLDDLGREKDVLTGGGDIDYIWAGYGDDADGGTGTDYLSYSFGGALAGVTVDTAAFTGTTPYVVNGGTIQNFEILQRVRGSAFADTINAATQSGALTIDGGAGDDVVTTHESSVTVQGGDGNDRLISGSASDRFDGGAGIDTVDYLRSAIGVTVTLGSGGFYGSGADQLRDVENITGSVFDDTLRGNEDDNLFNASRGNDMLYGNDGNDTLIGAEGDDVLDGGAGNDVLDGGDGTDRLIGGTGDDLYIDRDGNDTIVELADAGVDTVATYGASYTLGANLEKLTFLGAGAFQGTGNALDNVVSSILASGDDVLKGLGGNDSLFAGGGNDMLDGGTGADQMYGGLGNDSYVVDDAGDQVYEQAGEGYDVVTASIGYTLTANVEALRLVDLTAGVDARGNALDNVLNAVWVNGPLAAGTQIRLYGEGGNDELLGSRHGDYLDGGAGIDRMSGGGGDDTYVVDDAGDVVIEQANAGYDTVIASSAYRLGAHVEALRLVNLTAGVDAHGNAQDNAISAAGVTGSLAAGTQIRLYGEDGNDSIVGSRFGDLLDGGAGNDILDGGAGADRLVGGLGNDTYYVDNAGDVVVEQAGEGYDVVVTSIDYTLGANVEGIKLLNLTRGVEAHGNGLNNSLNAAYANGPLAAGTQIRLFGEGGNDTLLGSRNDDYLDGGSGVDTMTGGLGNDTYVVDDAGDVVIEQGGQGYDVVVTNIDYTLGANVEGIKLLNLTRGVEVHGNALNNSFNAAYVGASLAAGTQIRMFGEGGNDTLLGSRHDDYLDGGTGIDTMTGGFGNDTYVVDNAGDVVVEQAGQGYDVVITNIDYTLGANVEGIKLLNLTRGVEVHGNSLNNSMNAAYANGPLAAGTQIRLFGEAGNDTLLGSRNDDYLDGGSGVDTMTGGFGNDTYVVDNAGDVVIEHAGQGYDVVVTNIDYTLGANVEGLKLLNLTKGVEAHGNGLNNSLNAAYVNTPLEAGTTIRLFGEGGNDSLLGSRYGDFLDGGAGNDTLQGGGGNDRFHFGDALNALTNVDTILDFQRGDVIELDDAVFRGLSTGALGAGAFVANASGTATTADQRIVYDTDSGQLFFDADGSGAGGAVLFAVLNGHPVISAADFVVV
ncbi:calcium-binding protein [Sphingobium sp. WCS2017Hpa-17]|uniref:beta strand repeat-containing protein n=1 Tax=Sphingobium sp. WCS2017Hpa-17 TaxID=3073638 RepID=UPI0028896FE1|nr:calcium-binding protein [Sphingobium sp. WCS2017Hpa-17]